MLSYKKAHPFILSLILTSICFLPLAISDLVLLIEGSILPTQNSLTFLVDEDINFTRSSEDWTWSYTFPNGSLTLACPSVAYDLLMLDTEGRLIAYLQDNKMYNSLGEVVYLIAGTNILDTLGNVIAYSFFTGYCIYFFDIKNITIAEVWDSGLNWELKMYRELDLRIYALYSGFIKMKERSQEDSSTDGCDSYFQVTGVCVVMYLCVLCITLIVLLIKWYCKPRTVYLELR